MTSTARSQLGLIWLAALAALSWAVYQYLPGGGDWVQTYRPAALHVLAWQSPFNVAIYHSPPWSVLPLLPLAVLPGQIGYAVNFTVSLFVTGYVARRQGASWASVAILLTSYPVLFSSIYGNIDWLVYLGLLLPARWGMFFLLIKPQNSIGLVIYYLADALRNGRARQFLHVILPVAVALLWSYWAFGPWYQSGLTEIGKDFSASLWPQSLPIGAVLLISALRDRKPLQALATSPMFAPYVTPGGWGASLLGLCDQPLLLAAASAGIWIVRILQGRFL